MKLTLIEQLETTHPGLKPLTDRALEAGISSEQISARILRRFHIPIPPRTIRSYRARRWKIERRARQRLHREAHYLRELTQKYGKENAELYLKLLHLKRTLRRTDPLKLLRELRHSREHSLQKHLLQIQAPHPKQ